MLRQSWRVSLPNHVTLMQDANVTDYLDQALGQQYGFSLGATIPLSRHFSLAPSFRLREEGNIYTEALGMREVDRSFNLGVRVSY